MVYLVRTTQALGVMVNSVCIKLAAAHQPLQLRAPRNKQLTDGIPYMLRNDRLVFSCQRPQFCYNLAPRLMRQARLPNDVPAHVLVPVAFSIMYAKWCCKWFCHTWIPYKALHGELLVSLDTQTAWLETLLCPLCVCCLTVLRLCSVVIVEHHHFKLFIRMVCGHASTYPCSCSAAMTSSSLQSASMCTMSSLKVGRAGWQRW